ncbi:type III toxin-antitoxin system ToxN/AbiQ family toxin [Zhenhengia yiwuensis]|uniref:type III toxin-antitoxin system ToxN/AbiQ family toxin n=1 Tax=Zhenhengia yiwuensis TaxID=2763666 RepID=UPI002A74BBE5|nr:type III toxin-antitoxin system ToxN/AbiQ family toxin [Zhenhengia yiwuensis]MDY3368006.1 type III toxin-antitoxin system ToxN/AbiQ family toxin [Zhenhengia yiwuensis]
MGKLKFYDVNKKYLDYLRAVDSQVPHQTYEKNAKFFIGIVLDIDGKNYFAPVSSYNKKDRTNLIIKSENKKTGKTKDISSIRFSFMIPVPESELIVKDINAEPDEKYKNLLRDEYRFCTKHKQEIADLANTVYGWGTDTKHWLNHCCCDFKKLEQAMEEYMKATNN